ncbi:MAG: hypothetical protein JEZ09_17885 [Salinivirgaceae bacterium]|nr:hypothetical protein [Salinivirgaceae bacterium]
METRNQLKSFFTDHWKYLAVSTACKLHIFDHLIEAKTVEQLSVELTLNEDKLSLLLNALHNADFLDKKGNHYIANTLSVFLVESNPESLKYACLNWSEEHLTAWQNLDFSIKSGKSSFENIYGTPFFEYLNKNPEKLHAYHKAMYEYAKDDYKKLPDVIDFSMYKSVMDVGGSYGAVLEIIQNDNPSLECTLFDLEDVLKNVSIPKIHKVSGNFFDKIPEKSEAIILSRILHDWNDNKATIILKNCFKALPINGTLYIIENCGDKIDVDLSLLSLNMTAMCESYERTSRDYITLSKKTGFHFVGDITLNALQTVLIFKK